MKLRLHIDRLVLPEGAHDDPERLAAAVQAALADMLARDPSFALGPDLASGAAVDAAAPVHAPPLLRPGLPHAIAGAVLTTLRGPA